MRLNIFGDLVATGRLKNILGEDNYRRILNDFGKILQEADHNIVNLESPILEDGKPIEKLGPNLKSPPEIKVLLNNGEFDIVTLANNHVMDYGEEGLGKTVKILDECDIRYVGAGKNLEEAAQPLILEGDNIKIGIINIAEHEFNLASKNRPGANPLDSIKNHYQIDELKTQVDQVIVIVHGGHEHYEYPSPRMQDTYRFFIDSGADLVVGHHPHCYSGYEKYDEGLIFYSLGNFIFDKEGVENEKWNYGFTLSLKIGKDNIDFEVVPYNQFSNEPVVYELKGEELDQFENNMAEINKVLRDREKLEAKYKEYCEYRMRSLSTFFEPYENRYLKGLKVRGLIPTAISKEKYLRLYNYLLCQSHRDLVDYKLGMEIND